MKNVIQCFGKTVMSFSKKEAIHDSEYQKFTDSQYCIKRDTYWDTLKFLLIFLVVLGHFPGPFRVESANTILVNFVYLFHMPLFIFISGRFSVLRDRTKYRRAIARILETFLVFHTIKYIGGHWGAMSFTSYLHPTWTMWYLLSLAFWRIMVYVVPERIMRRKDILLPMSIAISLLAGFAPLSTHLSFQRTMAFLPFFLLGYYSNDFDLRARLRKIPLWVAVGTLLSAFAMVCIFFSHTNLTTDVLHASIPYRNNHAAFLCFARALFLVSGTVLSVAVMRLVSGNEIVALWGRRTMFVYVAHSFAITFIRPFMANGLLPTDTLAIAVYSVLLTTLLTYLGRFKVSQWILNPVSGLIQVLNVGKSDVTPR
ncbi:MAG: acyltransferase family protein [Bacteroidales bacterium]|nr:acyltransferase family protein [Bacteroidales bacterium]